MADNDPICPNFLYIGAEKSGSTWMFEVLRQHPEVYVPVAKDIYFFDKHFEKGAEWYLSFFTGGRGRKAVGELSHDYFLNGETADRIHQMLPKVKLIACLREPVDRTLSSYLYYRNILLNEDVSFEEYAFRERTLKLSDYYYNLLPFYERFPREQILVLYYDDLKKDARQFARRIFNFLDVDADFESGVVDQRVLPATEPRYFWLAHLAYRIGLIIRKTGMTNVVGAVKREGMFQKALYKEIRKKPEIPAETRQRITDYYRPRYQGLPELAGAPLPEGWL